MKKTEVYNFNALVFYVQSSNILFEDTQRVCVCVCVKGPVIHCP